MLAACAAMAILLARPGMVVAAEPADELPLVRVPAPAGPGAVRGPMVLLLSGDGDWVAFMRELSGAFAERGSPVLGLKSRSYLEKPRTPAEVAAALERAVRAQLDTWQRSQLIIVGYSRGADMAPFVVNRWPADLRERVSAIAFVGLSERASFEFHFDDLMFDVPRATDIPTRPEVERLTGIPLLCVQGADEQNSFCARPVEGMQTLTHPGKHRATNDAGIVPLLLHGLGFAP
jgi:type IV secretory pathway VirJ component